MLGRCERKGIYKRFVWEGLVFKILNKEKDIWFEKKQ